MTTALDLTLPPDVVALLSTLGAAATLVSTTGVYDPATGIETRTATSYSVKATPPTHRRAFGPETTVPGARLQTLIAGHGLAVVPRAGDVVTFPDGSYVVEAVVRYASGDAVAAWALDLVGN